MGKVILDMSMSLDGFIAGPNVCVEQPMGDKGERLHEWIFGATAINDAVTKEMFNIQGAVVLGKRTFEVGERHWDGNTPFGTPSFVLSSKPLENKLTPKGTSFTFVTDGIESALKQAKAAAANKNVLVMGGANTAQQYLKAGLIDEMHIHIVHVLLSDGVTLFDHIGERHIELEGTKLIEAPGVTHFSFRVVK